MSARLQQVLLVIEVGVLAIFAVVALGSARDLVSKGILPLLGGLTLLGAFVLSVKSYWPAAGSYSSFHGVGSIPLIGAGSLVIGVIVMFVTARFLPGYFAHGIRDGAG